MTDSLTVRAYLPVPDSVQAISTILNHELSQTTGEATNQAIMRWAQEEAMEDVSTLVAGLHGEGA